jgi:hypothetical protein
MEKLILSLFSLLTVLTMLFQYRRWKTNLRALDIIGEQRLPKGQLMPDTELTQADPKNWV